MGWMWTRRHSTVPSPPHPRCWMPTAGATIPRVFVEYTRRIIEGMGGLGPAVDLAARDIYDEWSACHHFTLYEEVPEVLRSLRADGFTIGLISNTQRSLVAFERHFELDGLFAVAISSSDHGFMKPHPSIFEEALASGRCARRRGGHGRRQPQARRRGCTATRDARRSGRTVKASRWAARPKSPSFNRCASCEPLL